MKTVMVPVLGECFVEKVGVAFHFTPVKEVIWPADVDPGYFLLKINEMCREMGRLE